LTIELQKRTRFALSKGRFRESVWIFRITVLTKHEGLASVAFKSKFHVVEFKLLRAYLFPVSDKHLHPLVVTTRRFLRQLRARLGSHTTDPGPGLAVTSARRRGTRR